MAKAKTEDKWAAVDRLRQEVGIGDDEIPAHAFTIREYQDRYGMSWSGAKGRLASLAQAGRLMRGVKLTQTEAGHRARIVHYWVPVE